MQIIVTRENRSLATEIFITAITMASMFCYVFAKQPMLATFLALTAVTLACLYYDDYEHAVLFVIDHEGIYDSRLGIGKIPWAEIVHAQIELCYHTRFLCLRVRDPERFLLKVPPHLKHKFVQNYNLGFTSFNVDISGVNVNPIMLKEIVERNIA